jgi:CheY-like chemotaxis protein
MFIFEHKAGTNTAFSTYLVGTVLQRRGEEGILEDAVVILVVEDDELIQAVVEDALTEGGFEIALASSGEQAVELLNAADPVCRALVTDINLAKNKMDGWAVARHARENKPDMPVVYMTGDAADDWPSQGVPNSILITKPFAPAQLVTAISQLLNTGAPSS